MTALIELNPIDPGTGSRVTLRVCASQSPDATGAGGFVWWPAITVQPVLSMTLFDGAFSSAVSVAQAGMELRLDVLRTSGQFPRAERYDWSGATAVISRLVDGLPVVLSTMRVQRFDSEQDRLSLSLAVDEERLEANVLFSEYAGTGGAEGTADLRGKPKPWAFGRCINVEPVFIDKVDNVYQVSGYGAVQAIPAVYERGASFGASVGNFANYAALVAANIPEGRWGTCLAQGMFRLGAPPAGVITCDVDGDSTAGFIRRTGAIVQEIARRLDVSARINAASLNALDAAVARDVNIYLSQQTTLLDLARRMAAPCNAVAGLALDGRLIMPRIAFGAEQFTLDAQGREMPPVLGMARKNTSPPFDEIKMGAARSWRVHSFDEIAFYDELIDRGAYDAATVYREGNIVTSPDQSRWLYINPTPTAGNAPPTWPTASNSFWSNLAPPLDPPNIGVERGANVTETRTAAFIAGQAPAATDPTIEPGANVTETRVSAAIQNQGALATQNAVDLSGVNVTGALPVSRADPGLVNANLVPSIQTAAGTADWNFIDMKPFALLDEGFLPGGRLSGERLAYVDGATVQSLRPFEAGSNVTETRVASAIAGQSPWATTTIPTARVNNLDNSGNLSSLANVTTRNLNQLNGRAWTNLFLANGTTPVTDAAAVTAQGTAAAIANQGVLATANSAAWGSQVSGRPNALTDLFTAGGDQRFKSHYIYDQLGGSGTLLHERWPAEFGANVTETRVASAISGQGALATRNAVNLASAEVTNKSLANLDPGANQTLFAAYQPRHNLLFNGRFRLGLNGWQNVTGTWHFVRDNRGQFVEQPLATGGTFVLRSTVPVFAGPGGQLVISIQGFADAANSTEATYADIEWRNGTNDTVLGFSSAISGNGAIIAANVSAANPAYVSQAVTAPSPTDGSGFVRGFVRIVSFGTVAYASGGHAALGVKVEAGVNASAISDEATDGAVLDNTFGRIRDPEAYNSQAILGPKNLTDLVPSYTVGGSNVTVSLPSHVRKIATRSGPRTLSYGSASGVVGFSQAWWAYIDDPELTGFASPTVGFTGDPADLMFPGRYQVAAGIAPDSGGSGGSANQGGGMFPVFEP